MGSGTFRRESNAAEGRCGESERRAGDALGADPLILPQERLVIRFGNMTDSC